MRYRFFLTAIVIAFCVGCKDFSNKGEAGNYESEKIEKEVYVSEVWTGDNGDGTYTNPILHADYSDPDVVRVGDDFYMTVSSFNATPGLPILHSKDLVNWHIINHALPQLPADIYDVPQHSKGVWAPCIRYYDGEFFIYWGDPDLGIFMVKTEDPGGDWSAPVMVAEGTGAGMIDPSPLWDEDGNAYLVTAWAGSRAGVNSILTVYKMSPDGTSILDNGRNIYSGHDYNHTVEGPKFMKRNGYYYVFAPAGGVEQGWQLVLRSTNIYGPYEEKVVMAQGETDINGPHQGGYVETPSGQPWFMHFQDKGVYGRILHLNPVKWVNDWPVIGVDEDGDGCGEPVVTHNKPKVDVEWPVMTPAESDEFNSLQPGLQWMWAANEKVTWSVPMPEEGVLRLLAVPKKDSLASLWKTPNLLLQRLPAPSFTATTKVELNIEWGVWQGKQAGLIMKGNDYSYLAIRKDDEGFYVKQIINKGANEGGLEQCVATKRIASNQVYLKMDVQGPDAWCKFSYSEDSENYFAIGEKFNATRVLWSSAKMGIFCTGEPGNRIGSYADFDWFRVTKFSVK